MCVCAVFIADLRAERHFENIIVPSVTKIASMYRMHKAAAGVARIRAEKHHREVVIPAICMMQRVRRGMVGRRQMYAQKMRVRAAIYMQRHVRAVRGRRAYAAVHTVALRLWAVTVMQRMVRFALSRRIREARTKDWRINAVIIPSAIAMQARYRGWAVRVFTAGAIALYIFMRSYD